MIMLLLNVVSNCFALPLKQIVLDSYKWGTVFTEEEQIIIIRKSTLNFDRIKSILFFINWLIGSYPLCTSKLLLLFPCMKSMDSGQCGSEISFCLQ